MKKTTLILILICASIITVFAQKEIVIIDKGKKVTIVRDTSFMGHKVLINEDMFELGSTVFVAPKGTSFVLTKNEEFRIVTDKTNVVWDINDKYLNPNEIMKLEKFYILYIDDRMIKIKGS